MKRPGLVPGKKSEIIKKTGLVTAAFQVHFSLLRHYGNIVKIKINCQTRFIAHGDFCQDLKLFIVVQSLT